MITLSDYLRDHKLSVEQFALMIGKSRMQVYRYLSGENRPGWPTIQKIAKATNGQVTADSFLSQRKVA